VCVCACVRVSLSIYAVHVIVVTVLFSVLGLVWHFVSHCFERRLNISHVLIKNLSGLILLSVPLRYNAACLKSMVLALGNLVVRLQHLCALFRITSHSLLFTSPLIFTRTHTHKHTNKYTNTHTHTHTRAHARARAHDVAILRLAKGARRGLVQGITLSTGTHLLLAPCFT
jgi:hypothetical protein